MCCTFNYNRRFLDLAQKQATNKLRHNLKNLTRTYLEITHKAIVKILTKPIYGIWHDKSIWHWRIANFIKEVKWRFCITKTATGEHFQCMNKTSNKKNKIKIKDYLLFRLLEQEDLFGSLYFRKQVFKFHIWNDYNAGHFLFDWIILKV